MYLINTATLALEEFEGENIPDYAILSHRWSQDEVLFKDMGCGVETTKGGFEKISMCCKQAQKDGLLYAWVDTCCIDKSSSAELSEAINSMFKWYQRSRVCYVYLADVHTFNLLLEREKSNFVVWSNHVSAWKQLRSSSDTSASVPKLDWSNLANDFLEDFCNSAWFTRGWTLQELIAPNTVTFFNSAWEELGTKQFLAEVVSSITSIPRSILLDNKGLQDITVAQRMSWAADRKTTRVEDRAYSLLGIFGVHMPLLYGEADAAFTRLQEEILKRLDDESILLWDDSKVGLLAASPDAFSIHLPKRFSSGSYAERMLLGRSEAADELVLNPYRKREPSSMTNIGLSIALPLIPWSNNVYIAVLQVQKRHTRGDLHRELFDACIFLGRRLTDSRLIRVRYQGETVKYVAADRSSRQYQQSHPTNVLFEHSEMAEKLTRCVISPFRAPWTKSSEPQFGRDMRHPPDDTPYQFIFLFSPDAFRASGGGLPQYDIICRNKVQRSRPITNLCLRLPRGAFEVIAIIRFERKSVWFYMFIGFDSEFAPSLICRDWHLPNAADFEDFIGLDRASRKWRIALDPTPFFESIGDPRTHYRWCLQCDEDQLYAVKDIGSHGIFVKLSRRHNPQGCTFEFLSRQEFHAVPPLRSPDSTFSGSNPTFSETNSS